VREGHADVPDHVTKQVWHELITVAQRLGDDSDRTTSQGDTYYKEKYLSILTFSSLQEYGI
jgi:hypothetical protein